MFKPPSRRLTIVGTLGGLVVGGLVGVLVGSLIAGGGGKGGKTGASASAATSAAPPSSATAGSAEMDGKSLADRAAAGDMEAKKKLEAKPLAERTPDEVIALDLARIEADRAAVRKRVEDSKKELGELAHKIDLVPKVVHDDKEVAARLKELTKDPDIARETLRMFSKLKGKTGPDLLYEVVKNGKKDDPTTELANDLLYSKGVRSNASMELSPLLDLRKAETCEEVAKALPMVRRNADRRALVPLIRYQNKRGCGEKKSEDCWPCLREGEDVLKEALINVQKRPAP